MKRIEKTFLNNSAYSESSFSIVNLFLPSPPFFSVFSVDDIGMKSSGSSTPHEDSINVVVRVRPVNDKENKSNDESVVEFPGNGQILVS